MSIAVCIPTYNQAAYLESCINSIMQQTLAADEVIISNDCSTDNTSAMLQHLQHKHSTIKIINQVNNLGLTQNSNACMRAAKCDYIVRMGSDDLLLPDFNLKLSVLLNKYSKAAYCHCNITEIDKDGNKTKQRLLYRKQEYEPADSALKNTLKGYKVAANIIMYRRTALEEINFLQSAFNFAEDYYAAADLAAHDYGNCFSKEVLAAYRVWNDKNNTRVKRKLEEIRGLTSVFEQVIEPAFIKNKLSAKSVTRAKASFALAQANCLSWPVFTVTEKLELKKALLELSPAAKARFNFFLYEHKLHVFSNFIDGAQKTAKSLAKKLNAGINK